MAKVSKVGIKITVAIALTELIIFICIFAAVSNTVSESTESSAVDMMKTAAADRTVIIENYISSVENSLTSYSRAGEIRELLENPTSSSAAAAAQKYTEKFSSDIKNLEGIYASEWNTHVLTHTNAGTVGITTRKGDAADQLHKLLLESDGVYNAGIIISPATGEQIISMYRACLNDNGDPIGLVGSGIFTSGLVEVLDDLPMVGMESASYCLINAQTSEYIFSSDKEKIMTVAEDEYIKNIINNAGGNSEASGYERYYVDGTEYLAAYTVMEDKNWVFVITDSASEVFAAVDNTTALLGVICVAGLLVMAILSYAVIGLSIRPIKVVNAELLRLKDFDITENHSLDKYTSSNDEFGQIARSLRGLMESLNKVVSTLNESSNMMFSKTAELRNYSLSLVRSADETAEATDNFSVRIDNTETAADIMYNEINSINDDVKVILKQLESCLECNKQLKEDSYNAYKSSEKAFSETKESVKAALASLDVLSKIDGLVDSIIDVSSQTNILSVNATIEAARAGDAGKGFAVVAQEIGTLASTAAGTAADIQEVCDAANRSVMQVRKCFETILALLESTVNEQYNALAGDSVSHMRNSIEKYIESVNESTNALRISVSNISQNMADVRNTTRDNKNTIKDLADKNAGTSDIAGEIRKQSDVNNSLAQQLQDIVGSFKLN